MAIGVDVESGGGEVGGGWGAIGVGVEEGAVVDCGVAFVVEFEEGGFVVGFDGEGRGGDRVLVGCLERCGERERERRRSARRGGESSGQD